MGKLCNRSSWRLWWRKSVSALIAEIPKTAFKLDVPAHFAPYNGVVKRLEHDAPASGLSGIDRIPRVFMKFVSLCQLDLSKHMRTARCYAVFISNNAESLGCDTVVYTEEPWMMMYALFEQAGVRKEVADASFTALGVKGRELPDSFDLKAKFMKQAQRNLQWLNANNPPFAGLFLMCSAEV